jgi:hypothetical protein
MMEQQPTTILEKTMEAGRALVITSVVVAVVAGLLVANAKLSAIGWLVGVVAGAAFLVGLVTVHAATAEALIRARQVDSYR